jgi:hypothetical protein
MIKGQIWKQWHQNWNQLWNVKFKFSKFSKVLVLAMFFLRLVSMLQGEKVCKNFRFISIKST